MDNICEYLFIKTETAMLSPHFVLLMRTPIVMPRPASSFLNIFTISVRCSMAVFCFNSRRSPTMQRIHRIYGGAPAISCASASHAPKRYTTSPALWRAQGSLDLRSSFALPSLDLRLTFAHPSLSQTATLRWLFGMVFGWG